MSTGMSTGMASVLVATGILLAVAGALLVARLLLGPTLHDRLVALDTLVMLMVSGIVVRSAYLGRLDSLIVVVLITLVGVLSTLTAVRLLPEEDQ